MLLFNLMTATAMVIAVVDIVVTTPRCRKCNYFHIRFRFPEMEMYSGNIAPFIIGDGKYFFLNACTLCIICSDVKSRVLLQGLRQISLCVLVWS